MQEINHRLPESMTVEERMDEVSTLLARGLARVWAASVAKSATVGSKSQFPLGYCAKQSVHTDPINKLTESQ